MKSMTGYGRSEGTMQDLGISVEVRSLNHRFLDLHLYFPKGWMALEVAAERLIRERVGRGRIDCHIRASSGGLGLGFARLDQQRLEQVLGLYREMGRIAGTKEEPSLQMLAQTEGVIHFEESPLDMDASWLEFSGLLQAALLAMEQMRKNEGAAMQQEIGRHLQAIGSLIQDIEKTVPQESQAQAERTAERIRLLAKEVQVEEARILQELAVLAERSDVTEELARLKSHMDHFRQVMIKEEPAGREMDFLLQEMNREINTLSSKIHSASIARLAVALKSELEKIREQVQNVE